MAWKVPYAPRVTSSEALGWLLLALVINLVFRGWVFMIAVGVFHSELGWPPKTTGFFTSVLCSVLLTLLTVTYTVRSD